MHCQGEWFTEKNECLIFYSVPVSSANGYIQIRHSTISYKQLLKEFTRNWGGSKCGNEIRSVWI